jgi:protein involved in polysaccharide export with SLBB domain
MNMLNGKKGSFFLCVFWIFCVVAVALSQSYDQATVERAKKQAAAMGVDVGNPDEVRQKAAEMGIPQEQIEKYFQQQRQQSTGGKPGVEKGEDEATALEDRSENGENAESQQTQLDDEEREELTEKRAGQKSRMYFSALPYFGYSIFSDLPDAFKPSAVGPVDPGYVVGPGDVLRLSVWGEAEFQYELTVSKEGKILIPVAGQVYVTGILFEQLQEKIKKLLSRHYSGLATRPPSIFMDLTVAQLKPMRIFIMGEVYTPGGYTVSSYASVFNALYSIGGPRLSGSLRTIHVYRNGEKVSTVDIYDMLLKGEASGDIRLQNNDLIFIPPRGKTVAIVGEVNRPAVYELKPDEHLESLLEFCGNVKTTSNIERVQVERVVPFEERDNTRSNVEVIDIEYRKYKKSGKDFPLYDLDRVSVKPLYIDVANYVTLSGEVRYPGRYQVENVTLYDLLFTYGQIVSSTAYKKRVDIVRYTDDLLSTEIISVDVDSVRNNPQLYASLEPLDEIIVYNIKLEKVIDKRIAVEGEVHSPGEYALSENMTVIDALVRAGGFTRSAYRNSADIVRMRERESESDSLVTIITVPLDQPVDFTRPERSPLLQDRDRLIVRKDPAYYAPEFVHVSGEVRFEGKYALKKIDERVSDIITRAGGVMPGSFLEGAQLKRGNSRVNVDFKRILKHPHIDDDVIVKPGDIITVPKKPNVVLVHGEVNNAGLFSYAKGGRVRDYIDRAGGITDSAHYVFVESPGGATKKLPKRCILKNPRVTDGSKIFVSRKQPKEKGEKKDGPSVGEIIRDMFAIATSAVTLLVLIAQWQNM